jgi:hypothetical protein
MCGGTYNVTAYTASASPTITNILNHPLATEKHPSLPKISNFNTVEFKSSLKIYDKFGGLLVLFL